MQKKKSPIVLILGVILFAASCAKEGPRGPIGPAGPSLVGNISGHLNLYDKYGSKILTGYQKADLYLNNSPTPINPDSTTGSYIFDFLVTGVYAITAIDSGYGSTILNNIQFVQGSLNTDIKLSAIPDSFLASFTASLNTGSLSDSLVITCAANTRARNCIVFVNKTAVVGNAVANNLLSYTSPIPPNATTVTMIIPRQDLLDAGFVSGATAYYAAYSYVVNDASVYEDPATGKNVYNAVNANPIIDTAIVP